MTLPTRAAGRNVALLATLCIGSGCAALVYQVVWLELLGLVIGASSVSLGVLLATFMGGMCIGSFAAARAIPTRHHPLRAFACLELCIGIAGLAVLAAMPAVSGMYAAIAPPGSAGIGSVALRTSIAMVCLLPPTVLMGATLPAIARTLGTDTNGTTGIGLLYAANLFGAVAGSLIAGFWLLRFHDVMIATFVAAALNGAVALGALVLAARWPRAAPSATATPVRSAAAPAGITASPLRIYCVIALSGLTALSAEVLWTRHLSLLLGATVYTFSVVLAGFLLGLGIGSALGSAAARHLEARAALAACQLALGAAIGWAAFVASRSLPWWPLDVTLPSPPAVMLEIDVLRVLVVVAPAALLWGASFPLALAAGAAGEPDPGRLLGRLYAANTLGAIVGALATSFVLIAWLGSARTQQWLIVAAALAACAARLPRSAVQVAAAAAVVVAAILLVPPLPGELVAFGRFVPTRAAGADIVYMEEGIAASIAVSRQRNGALTYHNAGKAQASTYPQDMRLQRMLGHLTTLTPDNGRSYLVIGLGAGITAGAVSADPRAERVVIADLEPLTREAAGRFFAEQNFGVVDDPKVELRTDDGRHVLLTSEEKFDGITSDPFDPWVKGAAALYTREFWQLARSRLKPGGVVTVFVQLYETTEAAVKSQLATFFETFPNGAVFVNTVQGFGYDVVLLARADTVPIDIDRIEAQLRQPEYARIRDSLAAIGFRSATELFGTYAGRGQDLADWLDGAVISTDRNLRLQYLAGEGLNANDADAILSGMTADSRIAAGDYFAGSPARMRALEQLVGSRQGRF